MSLQNLIMNLQKFWAGQGCYLAPSYDVEVGAGTMTPDTFFRVLGKRAWRVGYVQPSRRPKDGRYGENPHRVQKHHQFQVIIKPSPADIQKIYIQSLVSLGINLKDHDLRFDEDDWHIVLDPMHRKRSTKERRIRLALKVGFWLVLVFSLPLMGSIILVLFPLFGTEGETALARVHGYSALLILVASIVVMHLTIAYLQHTSEQSSKEIRK